MFEDNAAALGIATTKKMTPRTRHVVAKYFWFLEKIDEGLAEVVKIESEKNWADLVLTKNCSTIAFQCVEKLMCR